MNSIYHLNSTIVEQFFLQTSSTPRGGWRGAQGGAWTGIRNEECSTTSSVCPLLSLSMEGDSFVQSRDLWYINQSYRYYEVKMLNRYSYQNVIKSEYSATPITPSL